MNKRAERDSRTSTPPRGIAGHALTICADTLISEAQRAAADAAPKLCAKCGVPIADQVLATGEPERCAACADVEPDTDAEALDRIAEMLDGREGNGEVWDDIAEIVRATGRPIRDLNDE
jgi:hypothetical protein